MDKVIATDWISVDSDGAMHLQGTLNNVIYEVVRQFQDNKVDEVEIKLNVSRYRLPPQAAITRQCSAPGSSDVVMIGADPDTYLDDQMA
jgi:hypothetical protein